MDKNQLLKEYSATAIKLSELGDKAKDLGIPWREAADRGLIALATTLHKEQTRSESYVISRRKVGEYIKE